MAVLTHRHTSLLFLRDPAQRSQPQNAGNRVSFSYWRPQDLKQDDIEYAIENTQVILAPERQIATFGNTSFEFHLISELMDRVDQVRIRTGRIEAERPKI